MTLPIKKGVLELTFRNPFFLLTFSFQPFFSISRCFFIFSYS